MMTGVTIFYTTMDLQIFVHKEIQYNVTITMVAKPIGTMEIMSKVTIPIATIAISITMLNHDTNHSQYNVVS